MPDLSAADIDATLEQFRGDIEQTPPQFSAVKRNGVAAYRTARSGEHVEIEPRPVTVHELVVTSVAIPYVTLSMSVSTGTYFRAIARDLGQALGLRGACDGNAPYDDRRQLSHGRAYARRARRRRRAGRHLVARSLTGPALYLIGPSSTCTVSSSRASSVARRFVTRPLTAGTRRSP